MTDGASLSRVVTNGLLHCGPTHSASSKGSAWNWYHRIRGLACGYNHIDAKSYQKQSKTATFDTIIYEKQAKQGH